MTETTTNEDHTTSMLCSTCSNIPFSKAVNHNQPWKPQEVFSGRILVPAGSIYRSEDPTSCPLCPILRKVRVKRQFYHECEDSPDDNLYYAPILCRYNQIHGRGDGNTQETLQRISTISIGPTSSFLHWEWPHELRMRHNTGAPEQMLLLVVPDDQVRREFDPKVPRQWLKSCVTNHASCRQNESIIPKYTVTVIDCRTRQLVDRTNDEPYVTLSYVWGEVKADEADFRSRKLPNKLPALIEDALKVTQSLAYDYLWIDRYCISQNDAQHVEQQVQQMDDIYRGADLCIVAAAGEDGDFGLAGVTPSTFLPPQREQFHIDGITLFPTNAGVPLREIGKKKWATRGWTFQEAHLSRRSLVFTEQWLYFECQAMNRYQRQEFKTDIDEKMLESDIEAQSQSAIRQFNLPDSWEHRDKSASLDPKAALEPIHKTTDMIMRFSQRQLTFDKDSFRAFQGIQNRCSAVYGPTLKHLWGIPFLAARTVPEVDQNPALLKLPGNHSFFEVLLCWLHEPSGGARRREDLPSWTWAGWAGSVSFYGIRWPETVSGADWNCARIVAASDHGKGPDSVLLIEAIVIEPETAISARPDWGLCLWDQYEAYVQLDSLPHDNSYGIDFVNDWKAGRFRVVIMYGLRGDKFQGLVLHQIQGKTERFSRAGVFYATHGQKISYTEEIDSAWRRDFEDRVENSGWRKERFYLE